MPDRALEEEMVERIDDVWFDGNGVLTERRWIDGQEVVVHYDDVPDEDITTVDGIPCTTALRTVIDLAPELDAAELTRMVHECLERKLFTVEQARARIAEPDMRRRLGAALLREQLPH
jgi:hypothetical protein